MTTEQQPCAIVTGGSRGIGRAIAMRLAGASAIRLAEDLPVVVVARTESDLNATCTAIAATGGKAVACVGDVAHHLTASAAIMYARSSVMQRHGISEEDARRRVTDRCPKKRILQPDEVAEVVALLGQRKFATAKAIADHGGYHII